MIIILLITVFVLSFFLIKSADQVVVAVHRLSKNSTSGAFVISALFLAIATSLPELFVAITSGISGVSSLSLGNVIGANIANLTLVVGLSIIIVGSVDIHQKFIKKEIYLAGVAAVLPFILAFIGGGLSRVDGLILIFAYGVYALSFFLKKQKESDFSYKLFRKIHHVEHIKSKEIARLLFGIIALLVSANLLVFIARLLADKIGIPVFLVGLILVSIGTTLPELAFSIDALKNKEPAMFLGNLLGSIIVNSTLILGIAVTLSPINNFIVNKYLVAALAFIFIYLVFWGFTRTKFRLDRREAIILFLIYIVFAILEFVS